MKTKPKMGKVTEADILRHKETGSIYPLHGVLVMPDGERRIVERLPGTTADGEPKYEVHAAAGKILLDGCHSHLCFSINDVMGWGCEASEPEDQKLHTA